MDQQEREWREAMAKRDRDYMERGLLMHFIGGPLHGKWSVSSDPPATKMCPQPVADLATTTEYYELWDLPTFYIWKGTEEQALSTRPT